MFISVHIPFKLHYSNYLREGRWHMEMKNYVLYNFHIKISYTTSVILLVKNFNYQKKQKYSLKNYRGTKS